MSKQLDGLTGVRGVAALAVVAYHYDSSPLTTLQMTSWFPRLRIGYTGVDLFFILSGFVISLVHFEDFRSLRVVDYYRFLALRLARIYPLYLVTLLILVLAAVAAIIFQFHYNTQTADFSRLPECLLLIQAWHSDGATWNYPAWSLSAEWFAYLLFPVIAVCIWSIGFRRGVFLLIVAIIILVAHGGANFFENAPLVRGTAGFLLGIVCFIVYEHFGAKMPFSVLAYIILPITIRLWGTNLGPFMILLLYSSIVLACTSNQNPISKILSLPPVGYLGRISYSLYLIHALVQMIVGRFILQKWQFGHHIAGDMLIALVLFGVTIFSAHIVYHIFERPARRRLRAIIVTRRLLVAR